MLQTRTFEQHIINPVLFKSLPDTAKLVLLPLVDEKIDRSCFFQTVTHLGRRVEFRFGNTVEKHG